MVHIDFRRDKSNEAITPCLPKCGLRKISANDRLGLIVLKNSTPQNSRQNLGTFSLQSTPQETKFEKAGFSGKIFCEFAHFGLHTEFFNTIGSKATSDGFSRMSVVGVEAALV